MSDQDNLIALLEEYILEEDKEKILEGLVKNSVPYLIIKITTDMHKHGSYLPEESQKDLSLLLQKSNSNRTTEMIAIKNLLLQLADAEKRGKKSRIKNILYLINQSLFGYTFDFKKPKNFT